MVELQDQQTRRQFRNKAALIEIALRATAVAGLVTIAVGAAIRLGAAGLMSPAFFGLPPY